MLLERATGLAARITQYHNLKGAADEAAQFETRANQLGAISERIARTRAALCKLADAGVTISFVPSDGAGYAAKAKALRTAIQDNPAAINDPPFDLKNEFIDRLAAIAGGAEKAMTEAWRAYVAKRADFGSNSDVLSALSEVSQFRPSVTKIRQCRSDISALGKSLPLDPQTAVARLDALVAEHNAAWAELSAEDIPSSILSFIRAAANEGTPLATYTDEVRAWLESRNLLNAFRIRLR
jgi:hypothetical protein